MHIPTLGTACLQLTLALFIQHAAGNVEKTIFVAPTPLIVPTENVAIDDLGIDRLSPTEHVLRTYLNASFPTIQQPHGSESWFYLEDLNPGQRYEVRICWLATQPTAFSLTTFSLDDIVSDASLLPALLKFSDARLAESSSPSSSRHDGTSSLQPPKERLHELNNNFFNPNNMKKRSKAKKNNENDPRIVDALASPQSDSILFLRINAAADYFSSNPMLMSNVPPVVADIILDPFLFNVFPKSLVPTAIYTVIIAVIAYFVGGFLAKWLAGIVAEALRLSNSGSDFEDNPANEGQKEVENKKER